VSGGVDPRILILGSTCSYLVRSGLGYLSQFTAGSTCSVQWASQGAQTYI